MTPYHLCLTISILVCIVYMSVLATHVFRLHFIFKVKAINVFWRQRTLRNWPFFLQKVFFSLSLLLKYSIDVFTMKKYKFSAYELSGLRRSCYFCLFSTLIVLLVVQIVSIVSKFEDASTPNWILPSIWRPVSKMATQLCNSTEPVCFPKLLRWSYQDRNNYQHFYGNFLPKECNKLLKICAHFCE